MIRNLLGPESSPSKATTGQTLPVSNLWVSKISPAMTNVSLLPVEWHVRIIKKALATTNPLTIQRPVALPSLHVQTASNDRTLAVFLALLGDPGTVGS